MGGSLMYKPTTKLSVVLTEHPRAAAYLASINPQLKLLGNPVVIGLMAPRTDLRKVAERAGWTVEELEATIIRSDTEGPATATSGEAPEKLKEDLKAVLRKLYAGEDPVTCKAQFKELIAKADPLLIATAEAELAREGFSTDQLMEACDVHMDVFRDQLARAGIHPGQDTQRARRIHGGGEYPRRAARPDAASARGPEP